MEIITCTAPVNIAIIKYWGKSCEEYNLPLNSSLSVTLNQEHLKATTTLARSPSFQSDKVWLNGVEQDIEGNKRLQACFNEVRALARKQAIKEGGDTEALVNVAQKIHVASVNNFPTAAGLASSAAGYAALVFGLGQLLKLEGDMSRIARRGSGSACRSMLGGFVEWQKGSGPEDSAARQVCDQGHWPQLRVFILVVSRRQKDVGSTGGMRQSVESSPLLKHRVSDVVEHRLTALKQAISERDFCAFAEICMKESNQLHAVCLDTYPPLTYLNDASRAIIKLVHGYNQRCGCTRLAYTFDAGPNAFLFTLEPFADDVSTLLRDAFAPPGDATFFRGLQPEGSRELSAKQAALPGCVEYVICTDVGPGPSLSQETPLLSPDTCLPL